MTDSRPSAMRYKRRRTLINPRIQLKLTATFLGVALIGLFLQSQLFAHQLTTQIAERPEAGLTTAAVMPLVLRTLLLSLLWVVPLTFAVGILATFRLAGPLYRIEQHLSAVARGEEPGPCRLRDGDQLKELCELLNRALDVARGRRWPAAEGREVAESPESDAA